MGKVYDGIDERLIAWVRQQQIFFVSTAPLRPDGLVNCSPKGLDTLRILPPKEIVWLDVGGSGIETVAHLKENGRIAIMMCAFEGLRASCAFTAEERSSSAIIPTSRSCSRRFPRRLYPGRSSGSACRGYASGGAYGKFIGGN